ncbi:hypothetical protein HOLleu_14970 [Holothuria leucospilota]|uniref:Ig-like domain-containing protein n=1 Tax=Holothuria leucospilota TaxID=206669 RepID=A0A9Q1C9I3_HOLLE|nr:hypothetical protein HOLleu_14970 [Holothuria leucospilota]
MEITVQNKVRFVSQTFVFCTSIIALAIFVQGIKNPDFQYISREFAVTGEIAVLNFTFHSPHELVSITWKHNNENVMFHDPSHVEKRLGRYGSTIDTFMRYIMLIITNVKYQDSGNYTCTMFFHVGLPISKIWILQIQGHPDVKLSDDYVMEKQYSTAMCCSYFALWPDNVTIKWSIDGISSIPSSSVSTHTFNVDDKATLCSSFTFKGSRRYHLKLLKCLVRNILNLSSSVQLKILYSPTVAIDVLRNGMSVSSFTSLVEEKDNISILCKPDSNPKSKVYIAKKTIHHQWRELLIKETSVSSSDSMTNWILHIHNFSRSNTSIYRCWADNNIDPIGVSEERRILIQCEFCR